MAFPILDPSFFQPSDAYPAALHFIPSSKFRLGETVVPIPIPEDFELRVIKQRGGLAEDCARPSGNKGELTQPTRNMPGPLSPGLRTSAVKRFLSAGSNRPGSADDQQPRGKRLPRRKVR